MSLENRSENIPEDVKDLDIKIRFEDIDAPQDDKIWSVYSNGLEDLGEAVAVFITENLHRCHDSIAGFARNADTPSH